MNKKADIIEKNAAAAPGDERAITKLCGMPGALIAGAELSLEAAKSGRTDALLLASDAAHNPPNKVARGCRAYGAELYMLPIDKERLGDCIGRHSAVGAAALTDPNFGRVIYAMCKSVDPIIYTANKQITTQEVE